MPTDADFVLPIGRAKIERPGKDVTLVAFSRMVGLALEAAEKLAAEGIDAEVINLRSLRPLDVETITTSVIKTNRIVSIEEGWPFAGIGSEIAALMMEHAFDHLDAPVVRVTGADVPMPYAANLEQLALPHAEQIVAAAKVRLLSLNEGADPMPTHVLMPALSPTMTEGKLAKWLKNEGDEVRSGDVIAEIETDKATMEVEAVDEGVLGKVLVAAGTEGIAVNTPIAVILAEGEDASAIEQMAAPSANKAAGDKPAAPAEAPPGMPAPSEATGGSAFGAHEATPPQPAPGGPAPAAAGPQPQAQPQAQAGKRIFASPLARRIAAEAKLDLAGITRLGPARPDRQGRRREGDRRPCRRARRGASGRGEARGRRHRRRRHRRPPPTSRCRTRPCARSSRSGWCSRSGTRRTSTSRSTATSTR